MLPPGALGNAEVWANNTIFELNLVFRLPPHPVPHFYTAATIKDTNFFKKTTLLLYLFMIFAC